MSTHPFRKKVPVRRTKAPKSHALRKKALREDFNARCGYCDDYDLRIFMIQYQIDHFVPRNKFQGTFDHESYTNMVYACHICNRAKWDHWVTDDPLKHNSSNQGFIDPCQSEYDKQFRRGSNGEIIPSTRLGQWMYIRLKLFCSVHEVLWVIAELREIILLYKKQNSDSLPENLKEIHKELMQHYGQYWIELETIYDS